MIRRNSDDVDDLVVDGELSAENKLFLAGLVLVCENSKVVRLSEDQVFFHLVLAFLLLYLWSCSRVYLLLVLHVHISPRARA